ncbi:MAG: helix-turn-helix transcriptional regulator, partial [Clostridia bacterium]|nr:helix-turn-helix transcriptional regulator [Clostridia bacterium]
MNLSIFAERLSELMFEAELNANELAEKIGYSHNTFYRYLRGVHMPTLEITVALADFFHCSTDFLLGLEHENYTRDYKKCPPFSERFPQLLKECNISQYRLEKMTGIAHSNMGYWKNSAKQPSVESIVC